MHLFIVGNILDESGVGCTAVDGLVHELRSIDHWLGVINVQVLDEGGGGCGGNEWHDDDEEWYEECVEVEKQQPACEAEVRCCGTAESACKHPHNDGCIISYQ